MFIQGFGYVDNSKTFLMLQPLIRLCIFSSYLWTIVTPPAHTLGVVFLSLNSRLLKYQKKKKKKQHESGHWKLELMENM